MCCLGSMQLFVFKFEEGVRQDCFLPPMLFNATKKAAKIAHFELGKKSDKWVVMGQFVTLIFGWTQHFLPELRKSYF